jgi:hypothetical protein
MLKRLKNIILIDETLPKENLKKIISKRAKYLFFGGWVFSSMLLLVLSLEVVDYNTTKPFVDFMGSVVPKIKIIDNYIVNNNLRTVYFLSFYYSILWIATLSILPLCLIYNKKWVSIIIGLDYIKKAAEERKIFTYISISIFTISALLSLTSNSMSMRMIDIPSVFIFSPIMFLGFIVVILIIQPFLLIIFNQKGKKNE